MGYKKTLKKIGSGAKKVGTSLASFGKTAYETYGEIQKDMKKSNENLTEDKAKARKAIMEEGKNKNKKKQKSNFSSNIDKLAGYDNSII